MMKKTLYFLLIIPIFLTAGLNVSKVNIALTSLTITKSHKSPKFFNANKNITLHKNLKITSLKNANIVLFSNKISSKLSIVNSYKALRTNKNSIGAIYLKKGRTQIIFIGERLKANGLSLPPSFKKNLLSECQLNPICLVNSLK